MKRFTTLAAAALLAVAASAQEVVYGPLPITPGLGTGDFLADGTVPMTGNLNVGNSRVINVGDATDAQDALSLAQFTAGRTNLPNVTVTNNAAFLSNATISTNLTVGGTNFVMGLNTDSENYSRVAVRHDGTDTATIAAESAGTGAANQSINLTSKGDGVVAITGGKLTIGTQPGIAATIDVLVADGTTNRLVYVGGILVSNITTYWPE